MIDASLFAEPDQIAIDQRIAHATRYKAGEQDNQILDH
ncbi:MAG: hypothetical protein V7634_4631 [Bradyrhizobium sp.]|jgi:hypothetical protein